MDRSLRLTINPNYNSRVTAIRDLDKVPAPWKGNPIEALIKAHNFDTEIEPSGKPELLISTCIEFRFQPKVPPFYGYVVRRAGGRVLGAEFTMAYALAKGVKHIALIGHNDCGMCKVAENTEAMIAALIGQEWPEADARSYVEKHGPIHALADEIEALRDEYLRLRRLFRNVEIAPLFAGLGNNQLYIPNWYFELPNQAEYILSPLTHDELQNLP
jgi:carbonic anhydrase